MLDLRVIRRQNVVDSMATGAIGDRFVPGLRCQSVEGGVETGQAVDGKSEFTGKLHVAVTVAAGIANIVCGDFGVGIGMREDVMFAMAIGAERGLHDARGQSFAMYALAVLINDVAVACRAGVDDGRAEMRRLLVFSGFVRGAVAHGAVRRRCAFLSGLAVDRVVRNQRLVGCGSRCRPA